MPPKRPTVLMVDDSPDVLELYELSLADQYSVKTATNADDAFAIVRDWQPDIVITDISMPGRSGLDLITQIRSDLAPPHPQIGVISGFSDFEPAARSRGAKLFLLKPIDTETLRGAVDDLLLRPAEYHRVHEGALDRRAAANRDAEQYVQRFLADNPDADVVAARATEHVARYFGVSAALLVVRVRAGELRVFASSDPVCFPHRAAVGGSLGYATSVIASGATLYIPTSGALSELGELPGTDQRLVACAAVRTPDGDPAAGLAILSDPKRPFDPRDLAIVDDVTRECEDVLAGRHAVGHSYVGASHFMQETLWRGLLDRELERVSEGFAVCVILANVTRSPTERDEASEIIFAQVTDHMAIAARHDGQLAVFKRAADTAAANEAVRHCLVAIEQTLGVSFAATLTIADIRPPRRTEVAIEILEGLMGVQDARHEHPVVDATLTARPGSLP